MKKRALILTLLAIACLSGCTKDKPKETQPVPIEATESTTEAPVDYKINESGNGFEAGPGPGSIVLETSDATKSSESLSEDSEELTTETDTSNDDTSKVETSKNDASETETNATLIENETLAPSVEESISESIAVEYETQQANANMQKMPDDMEQAIDEAMKEDAKELYKIWEASQNGQKKE